jgi:hypothetical protein
MSHPARGPRSGIDGQAGRYGAAGSDETRVWPIT